MSQIFFCHPDAQGAGFQGGARLRTAGAPGGGGGRGCGGGGVTEALLSLSSVC